MWNQTQSSVPSASAGLLPAGAISALHIEYVTNPYGRAAPHVLIMPDGRVEAMTPPGVAMPGHMPGTLVVELLGATGQAPTAVQIENLRGLTRNVTAQAGGRLGFSGATELLAEAPPVKPYFRGMSSVEQLFEALGTPPDRRRPMAPGSLFNSVAGSTNPDNLTRFTVAFPRGREIHTLVVVPSHDPYKAEPAEAEAFKMDTLRLIDRKNGLPDFRAHYLIGHDGSLNAGRDVEQAGSAVPGFSTGTLQVVIAGNGKAPTSAQRRMLLEFGELARRNYDPQTLKAVTKDVLFAKDLLGVDGNGVMDTKLVRHDAVEASLPAPRPAKR